jgi:hypothetical protein
MCSRQTWIYSWESDLKQGISYLERERGEREKEIEGSDGEIDGRNRKIEGRDLADNKNPKQSWVA